MNTPVYHTTMKDMPVSSRPRERLLQEGPEVLSEADLLAVILRTGSAESSASELATALINHFGGLKQIVNASINDLRVFKGIGPAKTAQIIAALELGKRVAMLSPYDKPSIKSPETAAALVMEEMRHYDKEHFIALLLNTKNQVLAKEIISIGTLNYSTVHPRELYKAAISRSAAGIIVLHNHPSGDPTPSSQDIEVTRRLLDAGKIIGIEVLDHLVIGDNRFISFKAEGLI